VRRGALLLLLWLASTAADAGSWSDLWVTGEQQAQRLLQQQQRPAEAAKRFSDPRRRAYAELAAGQYAQAAERLKSFGDADSQYNRGNALAHQGQLAEALAAYDAALKKAPGDADIRHNRDLVARALQQQKPSPQQGGGKSGQQADNQDPQAGSKGQQGQNKDQHADSKQGSSQGSDKGSGTQGQASRGEQPRSGSGGGQESRDAQGSSASSQAHGAEQAKGSSAGAHGAPQADAGGAGAGQSSTAQSSPGQDARQAQADAAAGAQFLRDQQGASRSAQARAGDDPRVRAGARADGLRPAPTEQSLALDQWLQRIPEDSGELLRRKFLIEHMIKQQEGDAQDRN
jgi:Ca-activated chloride channel family protein